MNEEKKPLTGADIHLSNEAKAAIVNALAEKMKLRQWCIEQAIKCTHMAIPGYQELTKFFYDFVCDVQP